MTEQEKREKVINGLEVCVDMNEKNEAEIGCSHNGCKNCNIGECVCYPEFIREVIALLKAQEPVEPKPYDGFSYLCGECERVISHKYSHCPWCGRAVKWE